MAYYENLMKIQQYTRQQLQQNRQRAQHALSQHTASPSPASAQQQPLSPASSS